MTRTPAAMLLMLAFGLAMPATSWAARILTAKHESARVAARLAHAPPTEFLRTENLQGDRTLHAIKVLGHDGEVRHIVTVVTTPRGAQKRVYAPDGADGVQHISTEKLGPEAKSHIADAEAQVLRSLNEAIGGSTRVAVDRFPKLFEALQDNEDSLLRSLLPLELLNLHKAMQGASVDSPSHWLVGNAHPAMVQTYFGAHSDDVLFPRFQRGENGKPAIPTQPHNQTLDLFRLIGQPDYVRPAQ